MWNTKSSSSGGSIALISVPPRTIGDQSAYLAGNDCHSVDDTNKVHVYLCLEKHARNE